MKPLILTMEAFGTFAQKTEIDFSKLSKDGIFLVSGETGSGKTTIFDAICYALYGEANGNDREVKSFRSQYAEYSQSTYVKLTFECLGKVYTIERCPEYFRDEISQKGRVKAKVYLKYPDNRVLEKSIEIKKEIEKILGLNCNQFRQIVMIAQGEFKKFLLSNSDEKGSILNTIFGTQSIVDFINALESKKTSAKNEFFSQLDSVITELLSIRYDTSWEYSQQFDTWKTLKNEDKDIDEVLEHLKEYIKVISNSIQDNKKSLDSVTIQFDNLSKQIAELKNINSSIIKRDEISLKLQELSNKEKDIQSIRDTIKLLELAKSIEIDYFNYNKAKKDLSTIKDSLHKLQNQFDTCNNTIVSLESNKSKLIESISTRFEDYDLSKDTITQLNDIKNKLCNKQNDIFENGNDIRKLLGDISNYNDELNTLEVLKSNYAKKLKQKFNLETEYSKSELNYNLNIAGILSEQLKEGVACMVCGSTHHPRKAKKCDNAPSKEELETLKNSLEIFREDCNNLSNRFLVQQNTCNHLKNIILEKASKYEVTSTDILEVQSELSKLIILYRKDYKSTQIEINYIKDSIQSLSNIENDISNYKDVYISLDTSIVNINNQLGDKSKEIASLEVEYKRRLKETSIDSQENHIDLLKKYNQHDALLKQVTNFENTKLDYSSRLNEYSKTIGNSVKVDTSSLERTLLEVKSKRDNLLEEKSILNSMLDTNSNIYNSVSKLSSKIYLLRKEYLDTEYLYKVASGKLSSASEKIAFDGYVQAYYFERVLQCANKNINIMSNGRYSLLRKEHSTSKRLRGGLDIQVRDAYTGMCRSASTLSGGETFMASLSLALGLSEVVQQHSGGIKIDAMFIDEGFGTLDSNLSLPQAIKVLDGLTTNNRIVGIISHVSELQEHISNRLYIEKSQSGSTVKYI